jgi:hypothetical protein
LAELQVVCPVDFSHSPAAEQRDEAVPPGEHRAREKPSVVESARRSPPRRRSAPRQVVVQRRDCRSARGTEP